MALKYGIQICNLLEIALKDTRLIYFLKKMKPIQISRLPIFTTEVFSFELPNFEEWEKQIKQIVLVEDNKQIHKN